MSNLRAFAHTVPSTWNMTSPLPHILTVSSLLSFRSLFEHHLFGKTTLPLPAHCHPFPFLSFSSWHSVLPARYIDLQTCFTVCLTPEIRDPACFTPCLAQCWHAVGPPYLRVFLLLTGTTPGCLALESAARWMRAHHGPS